jgi:amino acid adenylation domain-containing protein
MQNETLNEYQASPQQIQVWRSQQNTSAIAYRAQCAISISGALDKDRLGAALQKLLSKYETLRTVFHVLPEEIIPVQVITKDTFSFGREYDFSESDIESQEAECARIYFEMREAPFDFENGPLFRTALVTLSDDKSMMVWSLPALCGDKATLDNLLREVYKLYTEGGEVESTDEPIQYADLSQWHAELLESKEAEPGRVYWRSKDLSSLLTLKLPLEREYSEPYYFNPQLLSLPVDLSLSKEIEAMAISYDVPVSAILLACWYVLIWRLTRSSSVVLGVGCDGRNYDELKDAVGPLAKYLPVSLSLDADLRFDEVLTSISEITRGAYKWQECFSWNYIAQPDDEAPDSRFFPVCFDFVEKHETYSDRSISFSMVEQYSCAEQFKVKLCCIETGDAIETEFHFDTSLINAEHVERIAGQYFSLLKSATGNPQGVIGNLSLLSDCERDQLLVAFNDTKKAFQEYQAVHQLFEEQARLYPSSIAVLFEGKQLTYAELNAHANQLARRLKRFGVGAEVKVAICAERSLEMIVALLAVLKAGAAYAPLDPSLPKERLAFILDDTRAPVLLTQKSLAGLGPQGQAQIICLNEELETLIPESSENLAIDAEPENLAYVIYTSGSTGVPKGVMVEHRQLLNYVHSIVRILDLPVHSNFATVSTFAADLGNTVIFASLCTGGCLHLISQERASDADGLAEYFQRHRIDCLKIVPSHLAGLLVSSDVKDILPRERLVLGGDATGWNLVERFQALAPNCRLMNHYGPTETTVGVLTFPVEYETGERCSATLPLGRPIHNTQVYVLDSSLNPVPAWIPGEVYIGGANVTRGYLNQPALTSERFIPTPFGDESGARMYRTGDLARFLPDGTIEFLGRVDDQVKIRGFRVELGEIESVLSRHPNVRQAVVLAREDKSGDKRLAAYMVTNDQPDFSLGELQGFLKDRLPDQMMPQIFVALKSFPLTPNGKVDRRALPEQDGRESKSVDYVAPQNEIESILVSIWQKVLKVEQVGIHHNYFSLGGDSIRVIQIVHEIKKHNLPVVGMDVFQNPTVHKLAIHISKDADGELGSEPPLELVKLSDEIMRSLPEDIEDAYPASRMQQFVLFYYAADHQKMGVYHLQHLYGMSDESFSLSAFKRALNLLVQKHPALRTVFLCESSGHCLQMVKKKVAFSVKEDDIRNLCEQGQEAYIEAALAEDRCELFDSKNTDEPLFRCRVFIRSNNVIDFLMCLHHAIADGWGSVELGRDLIEFYQGVKGKNEFTLQPALAPRPNTYKEFIALEREILASTEAADFWRRHLTNQNYKPLQKRVVAVDEICESGGHITISGELSGRLRSMAQDLGVSLKTMYVSAFVELIGSVTDEPVVTVGVVSNGRSERLSDPLKALGLFWNIVPLCSRVDHSDRHSRLLEIQQALIAIEQYARYPLPRILEDQQKPELFFATLNFLHFHNALEISWGDEVRLLSTRAHDKFHYPLNLAVLVDPKEQQVSLRAEYDLCYFSTESVKAMVGTYVELLNSLVASESMSNKVQAY